ncbi:vWA domain-containing protein [Azospirillum sp. B506]|uniref:vWA domain-containing protein n=1 Tax=Azospirillum sp. B506 TaxID=137721 RepID=UPI00034B412B|nr:vWA domain-containing protein [Azospirillum sp. B506]
MIAAPLRAVAVAGFAIALLAGSAAPALAQATGKRTPLLIEGKTALHQRVLTRPGTMLAAAPGGTGKTVPPMSVFFVYDRKEQGGKSFLEVGVDSEGKTVGWVDAADTIPWRHTLVMAFSNPANRERVLFFKDRKSLVDLLNSDKLLVDAEAARQQVAAGKMAADSPIVSAEPETFVDLQKQFYLLPILEANSTVLKSGFKVRTVRVASVTKEKEQPLAPAAPRRGNPEADLASFRSGVVFLVDATSSMQPYIDRARAAIDQVYQQVETAKLNERVRFGMIAYRDDPQKAKGVEYLTRTFADPNSTATKAAFLDSIKGVSASAASTRAFAEDGYAGLEQAIRKIDWKPFGGRYVIWFTDASSREGNSPLASTGLSTAQIRQLAQDNRVAIYVLHLQTAEGRNDHAAARAQYERLSNFPNVGSLYFPVPAGDADAFRTQVQRLAELLVNQVKAAEGEAKPPAAAAPSPEDQRMAKAAEDVGKAMRLAYLGEVQGTKAPSMFEAWASDRDFRKPDIASFSVRVLLTKNQLSDLQATLRKVTEAGERGQIDPGDFFNQLRSAAAAMGRDPSRIAQGKARNLEETGLMGEYLEGLPYQSRIMSIDPDGWARMGVGEQQAIIDDVKSKVALYQRFHDDVDRWVKLHDQASAGDAVYPVPLDSLP